MSAADGRFSAPIAASCADAAFSRAENALVIALLTSWFSSSSDASLPSASSLWRETRSRRLEPSSSANFPTPYRTPMWLTVP